MSRIGKQAIKIPENTHAEVNQSTICIKGPNGELSYQISELIAIKKTNLELNLYKVKENKKSQELYGLSRTIINNMIIGVSQGFNKQLEIQGVGYRAQIEDKSLVLNVGYSHPIIVNPPENIKIKVENNTQIIVSGIDKELVGQIAAKIRSIRPPEPYKGKGIRYLGEKVRKKVGKAGK